MPGSVIQPSFASGEISAGLWGRVDLDKYRAAAKVMRNFFAEPSGGASNRPGTLFVGRCKWQSNTAPSRLIPFTFATTQAYALEFGNLYMRVIMNGGYVLEPAQTIVGITNAAPGAFNVAAHGFSVGDWLFTVGCLGMTQVNSTPGFIGIVATVPDGSHYTLTDLDGNAINTASYPAYTANSGAVARIFTLATPYAATDLPLLKFTQKADVMTLTHPSYAPRELTRSQHWAWTLATITFASTVQVPTAAAVASNNPGGGALVNQYFYVMTALTDQPPEQSVPTAAVGVSNAALNQSNGTSNRMTWGAPASGPTPNRYNVFKAVIAVGGTAPTVFGYIGQSTGLAFEDINIQPDFTNTPPAHLNPFGGGANPSCATFFQGRRVFGAPAAAPNTLYTTKTGDYYNMDASSPTKADDAITETLDSQQVNAIKHLVSLKALLALTSSGAWQISGGSQSDVITPASFLAEPQAYVGCSDVPPIVINYDVLYVQAKQSRVRDLSYNFYVNLFTGDDKSVLTRHLLRGRTITQWAYAEEPYKIVWAVCDDGLLRGLTFLKEQNVYAWHRHDSCGLFVSVCSVSEPPEDAVYFIVTRTMPGVNASKPTQLVERMASRYMGANAALSIPSDPALGWFLDCALEVGPTPVAATLFPGATTGTQNITSVILRDGGANLVAPQFTVNDPTGVGATFAVTVVGGVATAVVPLTTGQGYVNPVGTWTDPGNAAAVLPIALPVVSNWTPVTTDAAAFANDGSDVGKVIRANGGTATVVSTSSTTAAIVDVAPWAPFAGVPNDPLGRALPAAPNSWSCTAPVTQMTNLQHLNGMTVSILADGSVLPPAVVANGTVALPTPASVVVVGLAYQAQLQTLNLDTGEPSIQGKRKKVGRVSLIVEDTRGLKAGPSPGPAVGPGGVGTAAPGLPAKPQLIDVKDRTTAIQWGQATPLKSGVDSFILPPAWQVEGSVLFQQDSPLPATILAVVPELVVGDSPG